MTDLLLLPQVSNERVLDFYYFYCFIDFFLTPLFHNLYVFFFQPRMKLVT